jgi:hypothetical protein
VSDPVVELERAAWARSRSRTEAAKRELRKRLESSLLILQRLDLFQQTFATMARSPDCMPGNDLYGPWLMQIVLDARDVLAGTPRKICGVVGFPHAGKKVCELPNGHEGYHQQGTVSWLGYHEERPDK